MKSEKKSKRPLFVDHGSNLGPSEKDTAERTYYRHVVTGDRGYAVVENGETRLRLDRVGESLTRRLDGNWERETERRPLLRHQLWRVAFESDKSLCGALGLPQLGSRDWLNLKDHERIDWGQNGPPRTAHPLRIKLFRKIMEALKPESE